MTGRIVIEPGKHSGQPPDDDFRAVYEFAASMGRLARGRHDRTVAKLDQLYPESVHVSEAVIDRTDSDFYDLATTIGPPPKVIWLRRWTYPTRDPEHVLRREAVRVTEFAANSELAVLILDRN